MRYMAVPTLNGFCTCVCYIIGCQMESFCIGLVTQLAFKRLWFSPLCSIMVDQTELMSKGLRELLALLRFLTAVFDYGALYCMLWAKVWRKRLHLHGFWLVSLILENETVIVSESSWALLALIRFFTTVLDYGRSDGYCKQRLRRKVRAWMAFHLCGFDCGGSNCYCERRLGVLLSL